GRAPEVVGARCRRSLRVGCHRGGPRRIEQGNSQDLHGDGDRYHVNGTTAQLGLDDDHHRPRRARRPASTSRSAPRCCQPRAVGQPPRPPTGTYDYGNCTGANITAPNDGAHVAVTGPYVLDTAHGWMEIHPAWVIADASTAMAPTTAPAATQAPVTEPPTTVY